MTHTTDSKLEVWVFDIDGTLADHQGIRSPFDESKVSMDKPIEPIFKVLRELRKEYKIIFVSGRTEACKADTILWLTKNIEEYPYTRAITLYMRKVGDHRKDSIIKKEIYDNHILPNYNILGVFDDRLQVCHMLYEAGIFCFNVNQGLKIF